MWIHDGTRAEKGVGGLMISTFCFDFETSILVSHVHM